ATTDRLREDTHGLCARSADVAILVHRHGVGIAATGAFTANGEAGGNALDRHGHRQCEAAIAAAAADRLGLDAVGTIAGGVDVGVGQLTDVIVEGACVVDEDLAAIAAEAAIAANGYRNAGADGCGVAAVAAAAADRLGEERRRTSLVSGQGAAIVDR